MPLSADAFDVGPGHRYALPVTYFYPESYAPGLRFTQSAASTGVSQGPARFFAGTPALQLGVSIGKPTTIAIDYTDSNMEVMKSLSKIQPKLGGQVAYCVKSFVRVRFADNLDREHDTLYAVTEDGYRPLLPGERDFVLREYSRRMPPSGPPPVNNVDNLSRTLSAVRRETADDAPTNRWPSIWGN
jgi:hypothetical protein